MKFLDSFRVHLKQKLTVRSIWTNCTTNLKQLKITMNSKSASSSLVVPIKCPELKTSIQPDPLTNEPDRLWKSQLKDNVKKVPIKLLPLNEPIYPNKVRFVCISDTHSRMRQMKHPIPAGDVLIHAGDFTSFGAPEDVAKFSDEMKALSDRFSYQVVIVGNHELTFDPLTREKKFKKYRPNQGAIEDPRPLLANLIYLEDSMIELFGIKIYGAPWQPEYHNWAYNLPRGDELLKKWNQIPEETDILITHGPPLGYGDILLNGEHSGCAELLSTVQHRVRPKYHIFGHIHEDHGVWSDGVTTFINASICNLRYEANNEATLFDMELPAGHTKETYLNHRDE